MFAVMKGILTVFGEEVQEWPLLATTLYRLILTED